MYKIDMVKEENNPLKESLGNVEEIDNALPGDQGNTDIEVESSKPFSDPANSVLVV